jgi:hypothetical protein
MKNIFKQDDRRRGERGAVILALMVGVLVSMILMGKAFQTWEVISQREREAEFLARGKEFVLAVQRFQEDNGALPTTMKQLLEPGPKGNSRYLRGGLVDPLTGKDWVLLWMAPDGSSLFRSDGKPSSTGSFRTTPAGGGSDPASAFNNQALSVPVGSAGYDADNTKSLLDAYKKSKENKVGANLAFGNSPNVNLGSFDTGSGMLNQQGVGPIAGVATSFTGQAFREWKGQSNYTGYEVSIFSFEEDQRGPDTNLGEGRNLFELPGTVVPDPRSPEGCKQLNTCAGDLGGSGGGN